MGVGPFQGYRDLLLAFSFSPDHTEERKESRKQQQASLEQHMLDFPRYFGFADSPDFDVPQLRGRHDDRGWSGVDMDDEGEFYHTWLAGYLAGIAGHPVPECQMDLCAQLEGFPPGEGADWLGHGAFIHVREVEDLVDYVRSGLSYAVVEKRRHSRWEALNLFKGIGPIAPFEALTPARWEKAQRELRELASISETHPGIDVGYRMPLAQILVRVRRTEDKLQLISRFVNAFEEAETDLTGARLF